LGLSRRTSFFLLIACLHAVVIYGFATGLTHKVIAALPEPMKISFVRQPNPRDTPPAIPESSLPTRKIELPASEPSIKFPGDAIRTIDDTLPPSQLPMSRPFVPKAVTRVLGGPGAGFPDTGDYYPSSSRRIGEMGVATVRVCVDSKGHLTSNPALVQSSGSVRLDQGALELAKAGSGHYRSTTEDGNPVTDCYPFRIRFELKQ
jgi:protein TonB